MSGKKALSWVFLNSREDFDGRRFMSCNRAIAPVRFLSLLCRCPQ